MNNDLALWELINLQAACQLQARDDPHEVHYHRTSDDAVTGLAPGQDK